MVLRERNRIFVAESARFWSKQTVLRGFQTGSGPTVRGLRLVKMTLEISNRIRTCSYPHRQKGREARALASLPFVFS